MFPLLELGPLRLSTGGLLLLIAALIWSQQFPRAAATLGGLGWVERAERCVLSALLGAVIGARLWYGLLSLDLYARDPWLFLALRIADLAFPGALLGGGIALVFAARRARAGFGILADSATLALAPAQALASLGMLLSGEALGLPTDLPWAVDLFGAQRHPTQLYYALAALATWQALRVVASRLPIPGATAAAYLGLQGLALLLVEALRADSLVLPGGVRAAQVAGLAMMLAALLWARRRAVRGV